MTRILIADDDGQSRYMLRSLLEGNGYEVVPTSNGAEALAAAQRAEPSLIISDLLMPGMDGFELCRRWKQDGRLKHVPFLIYTATYTDPKDERLAISLGADRFLVKPQKVELLLQVVREVLSEADHGRVSLRPEPAGGEADLLLQHNEVLMRKLQKKVVELEAALEERKRAEAALQQNASLLRMAGHMARLGGFSVDVADMRVRWSDEVAAILDMPLDHAPTLEESFGFCAPASRERMTAVFAACVRDGTPYDEELELVTGRGRRVWVRTIGQALRDASGAITRVQGALQDITEQRRATDEHQALQKQLVAAQRLEAIGRLAGGVAHDFNNLLSVVLTCAALSLDALPQRDPLRAHLDAIEKAGQRAAALTRQLLAFGRRQVLEPEVLDLNQVIDGLHAMLPRLLREDVDIELRLAPDLGHVKADPGQIEQVVMNLVVNARDAMPGGGKLTIETANVALDADDPARHMSVRGPFARLSLSDTGCGMDAATLEQVFEPFFTTKGEGKGTGLGLSIVYGVVRQSGGHVVVHSEPGQGTTVEVYLPQVDAVASEVRRRPAPALSTGDETVLVVEDDEHVRRITETILRRAGYQVLEAASPAEALLLSEKVDGTIDLLVTDVVMPQMSGRELCRQLSSRFPGLKTLYMSGYSDNAVVQNGVLEPGAQFIGKPFAIAELTSKVRQVLDLGKGATGGATPAAG
ncbi:MAG: response regulator [Polyangiaceae bacterium]|nr:response regulator [Polyangiaceae bacterium]